MGVPDHVLDGSVRSAGGLAAHVNPLTDSPVQAITVDGLVSSFAVTNTMHQPFQPHTDAMASQGWFSVFVLLCYSFLVSISLVVTFVLFVCNFSGRSSTRH